MPHSSVSPVTVTRRKSEITPLISRYLFSSRATQASTPNHFIRVNAAYRDECTELFGVGRKRLGAGDFEGRRFVIRL
jgi:hypothetical protein